MLDFADKFQKLEIDIADGLTLAALTVYENIILRSPVKSGVYRASNSIKNGEPIEEEGISKDGTMPDFSGWEWDKKSNITLFNNVPYAERIEYEHWSSQAPAGVYSVAEAEAEKMIEQELRGLS